jgi:hypothetical protein
MSQAKLEILISAKDAATQVLGRVKGAFAMRAAEINGMSNALAKNGEKVEKFLQTVSLAKMATETESFKTALGDISPGLQKFTSDMLNVGTAAGITMQAVRALSVMKGAIFSSGGFVVGGATAIFTALNAYADYYDEKMQRITAELVGHEKTIESLISQTAKSATISEANANIERLKKASAFMFQQGDIDAANRLAREAKAAERSRDIIVETQQTIARMKDAQAAREKRAADLAAVRAKKAEQFAATPAGRAQAMVDLQTNRASAAQQLAGLDSNQNPDLWLRLTRFIEDADSVLVKQRETMSSKWADVVGNAAEIFSVVREPKKVFNAALPQIQTNRLLQMGGQIGGGAANPFAGVSQRTIESSKKIEMNTQKMADTMVKLYDWMRSGGNVSAAGA